MMSDRERSPRPVLIMSTDAVVAALLGTLVELDGHAPRFPQPGEPPIAALSRVQPHAVLVDCDHREACTGEFFERGRSQRSGVVLFSAARLQGEVREVAERHGLPSFALPVDRAVLARVLGEAMLVMLFLLRAA